MYHQLRVSFSANSVPAASIAFLSLLSLKRGRDMPAPHSEEKGPCGQQQSTLLPGAF